MTTSYFQEVDLARWHFSPWQHLAFRKLTWQVNVSHHDDLLLLGSWLGKISFLIYDDILLTESLGSVRIGDVIPNVVFLFLRYRFSQVTDEDWKHIWFALFAEEYDYDSYNDHGTYDQSDFDYNEHFGNSTFDYTEFTKRAGFVLDENTLLSCTWRGRKCSAEVSGRS